MKNELPFNSVQQLSTSYGLEGFPSQMTCTYGGLTVPDKMEFFTGMEATQGDSWSEVTGDRFTKGSVEISGTSWVSVLTILGEFEGKQQL